jgi:hypothetical protein
VIGIWNRVVVVVVHVFVAKLPVVVLFLGLKESKVLLGETMNGIV